MRNKFLFGMILFGLCSTLSNASTEAKARDKTHEKREKSSALPKLLQEVESKYTLSTTLSASFSQITDDVLLSKKKKSTGKIYFKRPSKVRWETLTPEENLLVSDGKTYWFYTPPYDKGERGQLIEKKSSEFQTKLLNALLSGAFSVAKDMKVVQKTPTSFELTPKPGSAGSVVLATLAIDEKLKQIEKVILHHKGGNQVEITLSQIEFGKPLSNELFVFKAPAGTDKADP